MAVSDDEALFAALENQCKITESALLSKCNMNQQMREEAKQTLGELKSSVNRDFVTIKSEKFVEACKVSMKDTMFTLKKKRIAVWDELMTMFEDNPKFRNLTVPKRKNPTILIRNVPNDAADSELIARYSGILVSNECWKD
ncbi:hypothetical protein TNCT_577071 [Trichonephila clavata]|uniref:Uncharacterized protein n=1 Tax=Trichonephila clavata TaxID=2740835 RepID=A0A8X6J8K1_TRICU|nr:hypothetical protein TNCT_577071 [Trichonephila clavata]